MPFIKRRKVSLLNKLVLSFQLNRGIHKGKLNNSHLPVGIIHIREEMQPAYLRLYASSSDATIFSSSSSSWIFAGVKFRLLPVNLS